eukprot:6472942-Amphidinium_carterae.1
MSTKSSIAAMKNLKSESASGSLIARDPLKSLARAERTQPLSLQLLAAWGPSAPDGTSYEAKLLIVYKLQKTRGPYS